MRASAHFISLGTNHPAAQRHERKQLRGGGQGHTRHTLERSAAAALTAPVEMSQLCHLQHLWSYGFAPGQPLT